MSSLVLITNRRLTGKHRLRPQRFTRKLILQVEITEHRSIPLGGSGHFDDHNVSYWRDARVEDLHELSQVAA